MPTKKEPYCTNLSLLRFHLQNQQYGTCMKLQNGNNLILSNCTSKELELQWMKIKFEKNFGMSICFTWDKCLTIPRTWSTGTLNAFFTPLNADQNKQEWIVKNQTNQLMNSNMLGKPYPLSAIFTTTWIGSS